MTLRGVRKRACHAELVSASEINSDWQIKSSYLAPIVAISHAFGRGYSEKRERRRVENKMGASRKLKITITIAIAIAITIKESIWILRGFLLNWGCLI